MTRPVRVLIVDDSSTMRGLIAAVLATDAGIDVCGQASDPLEARQMIKALDPDVITLDVEMPNMNGIEFLEKLMRLRPTPVIMVSAATQRGADITLEALLIGAVDCVGKPIGGIGGAGDFAQLPAKIRAAAKARVGAVTNSAPYVAEPAVPAHPWDGRLIAIGSSTGGVEALGAIIPLLPVDCPPVVIAQHMPSAFTASLARRLNRDSAPIVVEAYEGAPLIPGRVYIAPGGATHLLVRRKHGGLECVLSDGEPINGHRPSVDALFQSVAEAAGARAVGAILTGMGRDGAMGLLAMRQAGALTIGQDEATAVIYGMPRAAFEIGAVQRQLPIYRIARALLENKHEVMLPESGVV